MTFVLQNQDIQGNILQGYRFPFVSHLFGRIDGNRLGAWQRFLRSLARMLTPADWGKEKPDFTLNVGISYRGVALLRSDIATEVSAHFSAFAAGMPSRARELGDGEPSDRRWDERHVWLSIHSRSEHMLDLGVAQVLALSDGLSLSEEQPRGSAIVIGDPGHWYEHFGFRDDISYPVIEGSPHQKEGELAGRGKFDEAAQKWIPIATGEFLLGHVSESGVNVLQGLSPDAQHLLQNGTFAVFRRLHQNVPKFRQYLRERSGTYDATYLASRIMGRAPDGTPLLDPRGDISDFRYDQDKAGASCPLGAHVRRVNPRTTGRHRIVRRGITFGPRAEKEAVDEDRGLWFVAFNASIEDQFEFLQKQWINAPVGTLTHARDPIAGSGPPCAMAIEGDQREGRAPVLLLDIPNFVTCQGGQYYFVPGRRGLEFVASEAPVSRPAPTYLYEAS